MREAVRGTLLAGGLPPLLGRLQRAAASGWLRVSAMEVRAGIPSVTRVALRLHGGRVVAVETEAREDVFRTPSSSSADLAERATAAIARILSSRDAVQSWEPAPDEAGPDNGAPWVGALAMRAVERLPDREAVHAVLGHLDRSLAVCPSGAIANALLTSSQRALLGRIRGGVSADELIRVGGGEAAERDLLALLSAGAVEWAPAAPRPAVPKPPDANAVRRMSAAPPGSEFTSAGKAPPTAPAPRSAPPPRADTRRSDIEEAHAALRGASHFAVLGLAPGASDVEVRQAFARQARRFHPDAQSDPALKDLAQKLTDLFVAVSRAHDVLKEPAARERYERSLGTGIGSRSSPTTSAQAPPPAAGAPDDAIESRLLRAEEALGARQPWEAIRLLEEALPAAGGALKLRAQVLLARAYADRGRPREAEKVLLDVLQADPRCLPACLLLGRLYRDRGMVKRAQGMFERVLEIDPRHAEARRELSALDPAPPEPGGSRSLLSRLRDRR